LSNAHHEELIPGKVPEEQFELLLAGTSIRSEVLIAALCDHLVHGLRATDAWEKHGVNQSQFSRRLRVLQEESARVRALSRFYRKR